jgi:integrase
MLLRRCKQSQIRPFRAHSLRHAKTKRSRKLIGIELASYLIGHADLDTTIGYDYIDDDELIKAVQKPTSKPTSGDQTAIPATNPSNHPTNNRITTSLTS